MHGKHGIKGHIVAMLGIGGLIFVGLLLTGRSAGESLYLAAVLSCPVMMIGMMLTMRGNDHGHDDEASASSTQRPTLADADAEPSDDSAGHRHQ